MRRLRCLSLPLHLHPDMLSLRLRKTGLHPLKPCQAKVRYALDTPSWEALRRVKIVPGQYTPEKPDPAIYASKRKRYTLVDRLEAIRAGVVKLHGSMRKMYKVVASRHRNLRTQPDQAGLRGSTRACLAIGHMSLDLKSNNPHRFMGIVRAPWINRQPRITAEWGVFCKACLPCVTPDAITVQTSDDPCLSCRGCRKCDYRHLGSIGGCEGCLYGSKHKHSGPKALSRQLRILPLSAPDLEQIEYIA